MRAVPSTGAVRGRHPGVLGAPTIKGASVRATVLSQGRHDKVRIFKHRRRKHYAKTQGHRQNYTELAINEIVKA